jgi:hypothetical protein
VSFSLGSDVGGAVVMVSGIKNSKKKIVSVGRGDQRARRARYPEEELS